MAGNASSNPLEDLFPGSFSFYADAPSNSPLSYEGLQSRRKIAEAVAAQRARRPYPTTIGEGIAAIGESIGANRQMAELDRQDAAFREAARQNAETAAGRPLPGDPGVGADAAPLPRYAAGDPGDGADTAPLPPAVPPLAPVDSASSAPAAAPSYWAQAAGTPYAQGDISTAFAPQPGADARRCAGRAAAIAFGGRHHRRGNAAADHRCPQPDRPRPDRQFAQCASACTRPGRRGAAPFLLPNASAGWGWGGGPNVGPGVAPGPYAGWGWGTAGATAAPDNPLTASAQAPSSDAGTPAIITDIPPAADTVTYGPKPTPPGAIAPSRQERAAMAKLMANPTDPYNVAAWKPIVDAYAADRANRYKNAVDDYNKGLADFYAGQKERRGLEAGEAQRQIDLRKGQIEIPSTAAQNVPAQDPYLNTDKSQQRKGYPDVGVIPPGVIPKDYLANRQKEMAADVQQVAKADLAVPDALKIIHDLRDHPGKEAALGFMGAAGQGFRGSDARDFAEMVNRANGGIFLQAFQALRGSGNRITNVEALKAEQALANLSTAQSKGQFDTALDDYEASIRRGYEVAQRKVNVPVTAYRSLNDNKKTAPDIGAVGIWNGVPQRYVGGNPASDMSYIPVRR